MTEANPGTRIQRGPPTFGLCEIRRPGAARSPFRSWFIPRCFAAGFGFLEQLSSLFVPFFLAPKGPYFVVTLISNTSNCLLFGTLISTPFQCLLTYISKHLSRSPPFPPRRGTHPAVASCCSVDRKRRVPQRSLVGTSAGGNVPQNVNYFCPQISPDTNSPVQALFGAESGN